MATLRRGRARQLHVRLVDHPFICQAAETAAEAVRTRGHARRRRRRWHWGGRRQSRPAQRLHQARGLADVLASACAAGVQGSLRSACSHTFCCGGSVRRSHARNPSAAKSTRQPVHSTAHSAASCAAG